MKRPAIFFDRDNTLIVSDGYLGDPEKVVLMSGAADAVARARSLGFATVVVSNQSGVARGMFAEDDVHEVNRRMDEMLLAANAAAVIDRHEFCPFHPDATIDSYRQDSDLRKPRPGMILAAADRLALDLPRSWVIGDAPRDIAAGKAAGCRTILLHLPDDLATSPAAEERPAVAPDHVVSNLQEAMDVVERSIRRGEESAEPHGTSALTDQPANTRPASDPAPAASAAAGQIPGSNAAERPPGAELAKLEQLADQILLELRKSNEQVVYADFSVSKLMAGIVQVVALALLFLSYLYRADRVAFDMLIMFAIFLQTLTVALLIMGKQR